MDAEVSVGEPARNAAYRKAHFPKRKSDAGDSLATARYAVVEHHAALVPVAQPAGPCVSRAGDFGHVAAEGLDQKYTQPQWNPATREQIGRLHRDSWYDEVRDYAAAGGGRIEADTIQTGWRNRWDCI